MKALLHDHQLNLLILSSAPTFLIDPFSELQLLSEQDINGRHDHEDPIGELICSSLTGACSRIVDMGWPRGRSISVVEW